MDTGIRERDVGWSWIGNSYVVISFHTLAILATIMRLSARRVPAPAAALHARPQRSAGQGSRSNYRFKNFSENLMEHFMAALEI